MLWQIAKAAKFELIEPQNPTPINSYGRLDCLLTAAHIDACAPCPVDVLDGVIVHARGLDS